MFSWDSYVAEVLEARKRKVSSKWLVNSIKCPAGLFPSIITDLRSDLLNVGELKKERISVENANVCVRVGATLWLCLQMRENT